jgi:hypothetical protein
LGYCSNKAKKESEKMSNSKKRFVIIKAIIVLIAPIIVALFPTERAFACSCVVPGTPEEEFKEFDAVFMGTVTSISERPAPDYLSEIDKLFYPKVKIGIKVGQSWKGVTTDFIYVYTGYGMGDCGYQTTGFETYLFYAYGPIDDLNISICSRTSLYHEAQEDRSFLESVDKLPLTQATPQDDVPIENNQNKIIIVLGGLTAVLFFAGGYLIVVNQKMKKKINQ